MYNLQNRRCGSVIVAFSKSKRLNCGRISKLELIEFRIPAVGARCLGIRRDCVVLRDGSWIWEGASFFFALNDEFRADRASDEGQATPLPAGWAGSFESPGWSADVHARYPRIVAIYKRRLSRMGFPKNEQASSKSASIRLSPKTISSGRLHIRYMHFPNVPNVKSLDIKK